MAVCRSETYKLPSDVLEGSIPFKNLIKDDIKEVELFAVPPEVNENLSEDQIVELVTIVNKLAIYEEVSPVILSGQMVQCYIVKSDDSVLTIKCLNPYLIIDDVWYKAKYEPCEELNHFVNNILKTGS